MNVQVWTSEELGPSQTQTFSYEMLTLGCPSAHSMGFKHKGLNSMLQDRERCKHENPSALDSVDMDTIRMELTAFMELFEDSAV